MPESFYLAAGWYGLLSLAILGAFAFFGHEVQQAFNVCHEHDDDEAWRIVRTTLTINGIVMVVASITIGSCSTCMASLHDGWKPYFWLSFLATAAYCVYTLRCDKRLAAFSRLVAQRARREKAQLPLAA